MPDFGKTKQPVKLYPTLGCCGLDCGLCPRYYTAGNSRCPGCCGHGFFEKHPSCSFITCCVKKKSLEVCVQCNEFPCSRFRDITGGKETHDSFTTWRKVMPNSEYIQEQGIEGFIEQQGKRIALLETMLKGFDDGRSKSYYCIAATLLPVSNIEASLHRAEQEVEISGISPDDAKARAKILRGFLDECAKIKRIELKLRKKETGQ